jgi:hypothetical protein
MTDKGIVRSRAMVLGEYVGRVSEATKDRPTYLIASHIESLPALRPPGSPT